MARALRTLQSGEMRHVGNLEQIVDGELDTLGGPSARYQVFATNVRFAIDDWKPYEQLAASQVIGQLSTRLRIRWRPGMEGVAPNTMRMMHVVNPGQSPPIIEYYDIVGAVRDATMRVDLTLTCIRRDAPGFLTGVTP